MTRAKDLQPDQDPAAWNDHVLVYEAVFEPFTTAVADVAISALGDVKHRKVVDVGAGAGGCALALARAGADVLAIDAAPGMVAHIRQRAEASGLRLAAECADGCSLPLPDAAYDVGISIFGIILFPEAEKGLRELARVVRPGGRIAIATWTEPHNYELATGLRASAEAILGHVPPGALPAQLRFVDPDRFRDLFKTVGLQTVELTTVRAALRAPSAQWLVERLAFAPGMASLLAGFGSRRDAVLEHFGSALRARFNDGEVALGAVASVAIATC
ncbi:MAG: methyltransferase domain-containing protein [Hyphomicrobiaceae bacterium]|nr:methyltransferase domain-containing protein [Hyphomicrobiaceae bacterium]